MRADDGEALVREHLDHRGEQPVIAGEDGAADAGEDLRALGVGAQVEQRRAADGADHDDVLAGVLAQGGEDASGASDALIFMRPGGEDGRVRGAFEAEDEHAAAGGGGGGRNFAGQVAAAGDDAQAAWHFCLIFHCEFRRA